VKLPYCTAAARASSFFVSMPSSSYETISYCYYTTYFFPGQERDSMYFAQFLRRYSVHCAKIG
jgi:hypothetical protein